MADRAQPGQDPAAIIALFVGRVRPVADARRPGGGTAGPSTEASGHAPGCSGWACSGSSGGSWIALETQAGFSGNNRYLVLGTAPVAIAGGVAWGWFSRTLAAGSAASPVAGSGFRRLDRARSFTVAAGCVVAVALFLAVPPWIGTNIISLPRTHHALVYQAHLREDLAAAVKKAGGASAVLNCGSHEHGDDRGLPGSDGRLEARRPHAAGPGGAEHARPGRRART